MKIRIEVFKALYDIALREHVSQSEWGRASKVRQPRIAELVRMTKAEPIPKSLGRACTLEKIFRLYGGLTKLIGEEKMKVELEKLIAKEPDIGKRILMRSLFVLNSDLTTKKQVEAYLKLIMEQRQK